MNKLDMIIQQKQKEVSLLKQQIPNDQVYLSRRPSFKRALQTATLSVIAEIKRKSPSKGELATIPDPQSLAMRYILGGANAISILTDQTYFAGHINDLKQVVNIAHDKSIPIMRKDFVIDEIQLIETALAGASAVLLIVAVLGTKTKRMLEFARHCHLEVLVEVHNLEELQIAIDSGADMIGINNRDLKTLTVDTGKAHQLIQHIPKNIITVAESGITHPALAREYENAGFHAVLIGEALVKTGDPAAFIKECHHE